MIRLLAATSLFVFAASAEAQRCTKGKPCGNTCIATSRTCRVGSGTATQAGEPAKPKQDSAESAEVVRRALLSVRPNATPIAASLSDTLFVGSRVDGVFFLRNCVAALDLALENRRYFKTEKDALDAKYRRSRVPGC